MLHVINTFFIMLSKEEIIELIKNTEILNIIPNDNEIQGLNIIAKYLPNECIIHYAKKNQIRTVNYYKLIEAGISKEEFVKMLQINWFIDEYSCFSCNV